MSKRKYIRIIIWGSLLISGWLYSPLESFAQTQNKQADTDESCGLIDLELVFVFVNVQDETSRPIGNLKDDVFIVYEDGVKQTIVAVAEVEMVVSGRSHNIYRIAYYPTNEKIDGKLRLIKVDFREEEKRRLKGSYFPTGHYGRPLVP